MDNNNNGNNNQFGYSGGDGGYAPPESSYNPDAQYGFPSSGTGGTGNAQQGSADQNSAFGNTQADGYNLNGQYVASNGSYNSNPNAFQNSSGQYNTGSDQNAFGGGAFQNSSGQYSAGQNQNAYGGGYNYSNGNYNANMGGTPLDKHGQPMKNNFAMKLTFSIIEMVIGLSLTLSGSWCFGLIPLILAVIACVMVCLQNKNYKESNWNSFVSTKKAATALLWVAFAFYMVYLVLIIVVVIIALVFGASILEKWGSEIGMDVLDELKNGSGPGYESGSDYDFDYEDIDDLLNNLPGSSSGSDYSTISGDNLYIDGFNEFKLNGSRISLPMSMSHFIAAGFQLNDEDLSDEIPAGDSDGYAYYDSEGNYLGTLFIYNVSGEDIKVSEGIAAGITINNYEDVELELVNGITFDTPADEAVAALGNPTGASGENGSANLEWYMNDRYGSSLELDYADGVLSEVWVMNYLPLEE